MRWIVVAMSLALVADARADGAWIGLQLDPAVRGEAAVRGVMPGSPGEAAGIHAGDRVVAAGGEPVAGADDLVRRVRARPVGSALSLRVIDRGGAPRTVELALRARPDEARLQRETLLGKTAPAGAAQTLSGTPFAGLPALRGKVVLLDFWATWCGPCRDALPRVERLHRDLGPRGLVVVGLSTESPELVRNFAARLGLSYTVARDLDRATSDAYLVYALPTMVLIDRGGVVRRVSIGDVDGMARAARALLDEPTGR